jgi:hypothetical protein
MIWLQQHYEGLVAIAGALWTALSVVNGMITNPTAKSAMGKALDALSYVARKDAHASVKAPFTLSKVKSKSKAKKKVKT